MKELKLELEELEARIAPSFVFMDGSPPDDAGASPDGGRDDGTFGPSTPASPNLNPWTAHANSPVLDNGGT